MIQPGPKSQPVMAPDLHLPEELQVGKFPWDSHPAPCQRFFLGDGTIEAAPFSTLLRVRFIPDKKTELEDEVIVKYQDVVILLRGGLVRKFHEYFCRGQATNVRIRGDEITAIELVLPPERPLVPIPPMP